MKIRPNELIGRHIYLTGAFDRSTFEVLLMLAKPGDVLLDIGANIGYVSACFLRRVHGSKTIAIDPQPKVIDLLRENLGLFGSDRYQIFPVGISDHDSKAWLEIDEANNGASKVVDSNRENTVEIELWSAQRLFAAIGDQKVDLVKIDVEGHEHAILASCLPFFEKYKPRAILFEDHTKSAAPNGSIGLIFERLGYQVRGIRKRLTKLDFVPITSVIDCQYNDYLATPTIDQRTRAPNAQFYP
jgi:FkbM family methyltransferase